MNKTRAIPLINLEKPRYEIVQKLKEACRECGFFLIENHGVPEALEQKLASLSEIFFAQKIEQKMKISMHQGGIAWRGFFPVGNELTSGKMDLKEGIYFGEELTSEDARVKARIPLHGANQFPDIPGFREVVLTYLTEMKRLGDLLIELISLSLELPEDYFKNRYTNDPTELFRIFHYPPVSPELEAQYPWGVGEHTDYGLLTILKQDDVGGLEVKVGTEWIPVPPHPGTLVCNVGDMLDFLTKGYYRSAPHRVKNASGRERFSFPYFYDPDFAAKIEALPNRPWGEGHYTERWDQANLYQFQGTYGDYLLGKVSKVFPELAGQQKILT